MDNPIDFMRQGLSSAVDKSLSVSQSVVRRHVERIRRARPDATPAEVLSSLDKQYVATVTAMGAAAGASAAVPGVGTAGAIGVNLAQVGTFLQTSTMYVLAVAEVHGVPVEDLERRRTLLLAVLLGNGGSTFVQRAAGRTAPYWGRAIADGIPMSAIRSANRVLGPRFITRYGTRQGILVLGREVPFGLGAAIGAGGNAALGRATVKAARRAFGPPPSEFPFLLRTTA